jgi:quercetin dioxygenase-like cupin family protein
MTPDIFNNLPPVEVIKGFHGRFVHTQHSTLAYWHIDEGSVLPLHHHIHEQCTWVLEGELEMTVNGEKKLCGAGSFVVIAPNVPHEGRALTNCRVFDIFCPVREDYRNLAVG